MRSRLLLGAVVLVLLGLAGSEFLLWLTAPEPGVTRRNYDRVKAGMTRPEVETILGASRDSQTVSHTPGVGQSASGTTEDL